MLVFLCGSQRDFSLRTQRLKFLPQRTLRFSQRAAEVAKVLRKVKVFMCIRFTNIIIATMKINSINFTTFAPYEFTSRFYRNSKKNETNYE